MSGSYQALRQQLNQILALVLQISSSGATLAGNNIFTGINTFTAGIVSSSIYLLGRFYDMDNSSGNVGDVLSSTSTGVRWIAGTGLITPSFQEVCDVGSITTTPITVQTIIITDAPIPTPILVSSLKSLEINVGGSSYYLPLYT